MSNHNYSSNGLFEASTAPGPVAHQAEEMFQCMWGYEHGLHCNSLIRGINLSVHLHEIHGISSQETTRAECKWKHCGQQFNIENLCEHVEGTHMGIRYFCDCGGMFLRRDILRVHKENCSGQQYVDGEPFNMNKRQDVRR